LGNVRLPLAVLALSLALYLPLAVAGDFVGDAFLYVQHAHRAAGSPEALLRSFGEPYFGTLPTAFRPATVALAAAEAAAFGTRPTGWLLAAAALVGVAGILVGALARAVGGAFGIPAERRAKLAIAGAFLFVTAPVHVDAVADVAAGSDLVAAIFASVSLLALVGALSGRRGLLVVVVLLAFASYLSKELAWTLPGAGALLALALPAPTVRRRLARAGAAAAVLVAPLLAVFGLRAVILGAALPPSPVFGAILEQPPAVVARVAIDSVLSKLRLLFFAPHFESSTLVAGATLALFAGATLWAAIRAGSPARTGRWTVATAVAALVALGPALAIHVDVTNLFAARHLHVASLVAPVPLAFLFAGSARSLTIPLVLACAAGAAATAANQLPWIRGMRELSSLRKEIVRAVRAEPGPLGVAVALDAPEYREGTPFWIAGTGPAFEPPFDALDVPVAAFASKKLLLLDRAGEVPLTLLRSGILATRRASGAGEWVSSSLGGERPASAEWRGETLRRCRVVAGRAEPVAEGIRVTGGTALALEVDGPPLPGASLRLAGASDGRIRVRWSGTGGAHGPTTLHPMRGTNLRVAALGQRLDYVLAGTLRSLEVTFESATTVEAIAWSEEMPVAEWPDGGEPLAAAEDVEILLPRSDAVLAWRIVLARGDVTHVETIAPALAEGTRFRPASSPDTSAAWSRFRSLGEVHMHASGLAAPPDPTSAVLRTSARRLVPPPR